MEEEDDEEETTTTSMVQGENGVEEEAGTKTSVWLKTDPFGEDKEFEPSQFLAAFIESMAVKLGTPLSVMLQEMQQMLKK